MRHGSTWSVLVACSVLALVGCGGADAPPEPAAGDTPRDTTTAAADPTAGEALDALIDRYLDDYFQSQPPAATRAGIRGHDHRLQPLREADFEARADRLRGFLDELSAIAPKSLANRDLVVDHELLRRHASVQLAEIERFPRWRREPGMYMPFNAFNDLVVGRFAPAEQRAEWLTQRLRALPESLDAARENLRNPPERFTRDAINTADNLRRYFEQAVPAFADELADEADPDALRSAATTAAEAMVEFGTFLENDLLPRSDGAIAAGEDMYRFYLREIHGVEVSPAELLELGQRYYDQTLALLEAQAEEIDPDSTWVEITERIRDNHPEKDDLRAAYCREIWRARDHVIEHGLASVPPGEEVRCIDSDPAQRAFSPFGTFRSPAPFDEDRTGYLILHPVPEGLSPEREEEILRAHDLSWIQVIAPHEAYPGHHLQAILAQQNERPLRKVYSTPVFGEGWGLYTEELMWEHGFFDPEPETRLTQLRLRLWRSARVLLDAGLHTGELDFDDARDFLAENIRMEYGSTAGEVNIYAYRPSYAIGYVVGFYEMMRLRADYRAQAGDDFDLGAFHDRVLRLGSMPFGLVRDLIGLPRPEDDALPTDLPED